MMQTIYALIDPRDGKVFYVGRTSNMHHRLLKHNSISTNIETPKNLFIREIRATGLKVTHIVLDTVAKADSKFWESFYTDLYRSWGFTLLNNLYHKMGNQTSFKPDSNLVPVVALNRQGEFCGEFKSSKEANSFAKVTSVAQSLTRRKKVIGGYIWFYKSEYDSASRKEIDKVLLWANTSERVANSGSFKKGHNSKPKIKTL